MIVVRNLDELVEACTLETVTDDDGREWLRITAPKGGVTLDCRPATSATTRPRGGVCACGERARAGLIPHMPGCPLGRRLKYR